MNITYFLFFTIVALFLEFASGYYSLKCPPLTIKRGKVRLRSRGRIAKYTCLRGFQLLGERYSTCLRGQWDTPAPVCIGDGCSPVGDIFIHGQTFESYNGALVKFQCDPGYRLIGSPALYCNGVFWNDTLPVCRASPEIAKKAQRWCDFESEDLCGWTHDLNQNFEWRRHNFATPSGHLYQTGPAYDHTLGAGLAGHYMYLEASDPRLQNDTARLFSPVFPAITSNTSCFIFWYHMYGANIGSLQVYVHAQKVSLVFSETGNHGNQWLKGLIPLPPIDTSFQIVIEGVQGAGYIGDTAIDDVKLAEGDECIDDPVTVSIFGSCQGRCHSNVTVDIFTCECTVDCIDNSTCCPDFVILCVNAQPSNGSRLTSPMSSIPLTSQPVSDMLPSFSSLPTKSYESVIPLLSTTTPSYNLTSLQATTINNTSPSVIINTVENSTGNKLQTLVTHLTPGLNSTLRPSTQSINTASVFPLPSPTTTTKQPRVVEPSTQKLSTTSTKTNPWYNRTSLPTSLSTLVIKSITKSSYSVTQAPDILVTKMPVLLTPFTFFPKFKPTLLPTQFRVGDVTTSKKITLIIHTPPPPIVFRKPQFDFPLYNVTKLRVKKITLAPNLLTTVLAKRTESPSKIPLFEPEKKLTKNNIINGYWNKMTSLQIPTLSPKPNVKPQKYSTNTFFMSSPSDEQTTPITTSVFKKKFKPKYKMRGSQAQLRVVAEENKLTVAIIAAGLGLFALLVVASVAVVCYVRNRRINRRSDMDGEADVLYITSDEILDFSLARPSSSVPSVCESQR